MLVVGVVLVFGFMALTGMFGGSDAPVEQAAPQNRIIVAKHDIAQGSVISVMNDLDWKPVEDGEIKEDQLREGAVRLEDFEGAISRRQLRGGDPVPMNALTRAGEGGFMSAVLEPGMRAVSLAVSATSGNAGFISPGDRVDLLVTHRIHASGSTNNAEGTVVSETFIHDVRVIAVDQLLDNPDNRAILAKTVTVEVSPEDAEKVAVANDLGKISLALRSIANEPPAASDPVPAPDPAKETLPEAAEVLADDSQGAVEKTAQPVELKPVAAHIDALGFTRDKDVSRALESNGVSPTIRVIRGDQVENVSLR